MTQWRQLALPALLLGAAGAGLSPIFMRLSELPPTSSAFYRVFLALPPLLLWQWVEAPSQPEEKTRLSIPLAECWASSFSANWILI